MLFICKFIIICRRTLLALSILSTAISAHADLPLTVEDLITDKGKFKLDLSLAYANSDRQGIFTGEPITVQTGPTSFVNLPTLIGQSLGNSDSLVGTLGLRYGLTGKAEIFARASYLTSNSRSGNITGTSESSEAAFPMPGQASTTNSKKTTIPPL